MNLRSVLAVMCGAAAYLACYGLFLFALNVMMARSLSARLTTGLVILWIISTALSGVATSWVRGTRSFFHGCAAGVLGAVLMIAILRRFVGSADHTGPLAVFWVIASAALGGVGALVGREPNESPPPSVEL